MSTAKWFTSDLHFQHQNICKFTDRKHTVSQEDHDEWLIELWNSVVKAGDLVYHLGDFSFSKGYDSVKSIVQRLNGNKIFIKGNHDRSEHLQRLQLDGLITKWSMYEEIKVAGNSTVLFHFPISSWHKQSYGSWHLHGHCVDQKTEILTKDGFKNRENIKEGDLVYSYNKQSGVLELNPVEVVLDVLHTGKVYSYFGKSVNMRVTDKHTLVGFNISNKNKFIEFQAENIPSRFYSITSCESTNNGCGLSQNMLKLFICIASDGSIKEQTSLVRIRVKKPHKKIYIENLLQSLNIKYNKYDKMEYSSYNFYVPEELVNWNFKGLDKKLLNANREDCFSIIDAYCNADGHKQKNGVIIYSAKQKEIEILNQMFVVNGFCCTSYKRNHGFSGKEQNQLSVTNNQTKILIKGNFIEENVVSEPFWCIKVKNQNFICRREGKTHLTGNCHSNLKEYHNKGKMLDVGIDNAYKLTGKHQFYNEELIAEYMSHRELYIADEHRKENGR